MKLSKGSQVDWNVVVRRKDLSGEHRGWANDGDVRVGRSHTDGWVVSFAPPSTLTRFLLPFTGEYRTICRSLAPGLQQAAAMMGQP
jgi:hypothetical protein